MSRLVEWHEAGRKLTSLGGSSHTLACLNYGHSGSAYSYGYLEAAHVLVAEVFESGRRQDLLIFPILFQYRHHCELQLKRSLVNALFVTDTQEGVGDSHDVALLWSRYRTAFKKIYGRKKDETLIAIDGYLNELSELDPSSQAFRYEKDNTGAKSLEGITHLDIANLFEILEEIASFLDGAQMDMQERMEKKAEKELDATELDNSSTQDG